MPYLSIGEAFRKEAELSQKLGVLEKEHTAAWKDMKLDLLSLRDENTELRKKQELLFEWIKNGLKSDPRLIGLDPKLLNEKEDTT